MKYLALVQCLAFNNCWVYMHRMELEQKKVAHLMRIASKKVMGCLMKKSLLLSNKCLYYPEYLCILSPILLPRQQRKTWPEFGLRTGFSLLIATFRWPFVSLNVLMSLIKSVASPSALSILRLSKSPFPTTVFFIYFVLWINPVLGVGG